MWVAMHSVASVCLRPVCVLTFESLDPQTSSQDSNLQPVNGKSVALPIEPPGSVVELNVVESKD